MRRMAAVSATALALAGCGGSGDGLSVTVTAPPAGGAVADESYIIEWDAENVYWSDAYVNIYADTDNDPSTGLVLLEDSIDTGTSGWLWDCSSWPAGDYYIRAVIHDGEDEDASDYSDGAVTVTHEPLGEVSGLYVVADSSQGTEVHLAWTPLFGASSYRVYFDPYAAGTWQEVAETPQAHYVHEATSAGIYGVKGVRDEETSPGYGDTAGTMPFVDDSLYVIWDETAPAGSFNAARLTPCGAYLSDYAPDDYDIHCRQSGTGLPVHLFAGDAPPLGGGNSTPLLLTPGSYSIAPESGYADSLALSVGDVLFGHMEETGFYVKIMVDYLPERPGVPGCYGVGFRYEFQTIQGLRLFTPGS